MNIATKAEAQRNLDAAKEKAGKAYVARANSLSRDPLQAVHSSMELDAAKLHYDRCIRELEEAINEMGNWDNGDNDSP
jgi:hypothetical protein